MKWLWKSSMAKAATRRLVAPDLVRERGFDRRHDPVDRIGFLDHGRVVELGRRRVDVAAGCNHERDLAFAKEASDWPHILALEVHVEDGEVEPALFNLVESALDGVARSADLVAKRIEEILEHHRNERLVFDDEDGTLTRH